MELNKLAAELHEAALAKGFWDVEDACKKHVVKMLSELGEVVQADRAGIMYEIERDGAKPEGVAAELADFVMMALDFCAAMEIDIERMLIGITYDSVRARVESEMRDSSIPDLVLMMDSALNTLTEPDPDGFNAFGTALLSVVYLPRLWLELRGYDLFEIIRLKMEYNQKSRAYLHGRKY